MESEGGVSSQRCGPLPFPATTLQPATLGRDCDWPAKYCWEGREAGPWPPWSRRAPRVRREARRRACGHPQPVGGGRACSHVLPGRHSERLCRGSMSCGGRGGEVHSQLCAAVAADRGREGRRAACYRCVEPRAVPAYNLLKPFERVPYEISGHLIIPPMPPPQTSEIFIAYYLLRDLPP
jgi:hypothetical protein